MNPFYFLFSLHILTLSGYVNTNSVSYIEVQCADLCLIYYWIYFLYIYSKKGTTVSKNTAYSGVHFPVSHHNTGQLNILEKQITNNLIVFFCFSWYPYLPYFSCYHMLVHSAFYLCRCSPNEWLQTCICMLLLIPVYLWAACLWPCCLNGI